MSTALRLIDETPGGEVTNEFTLVLVSERVSARDIIAARIEQEVKAFNEQPLEEVFRGLVQPTETEEHLNGYRLKKRRVIDPARQIKNAVEAFGTNGFFMLVDDRQVESLDEEFVVTNETLVSFVKLVPLVGG